MGNLNFPASYAAISEADQRSVTGGNEFSDALGDFFENIQFDNFFWGTSLITISFTFVPLLLFNVVKTGYFFVKDVSNSLLSLFASLQQSSISTAADGR